MLSTYGISPRSMVFPPVPELDQDDHRSRLIDGAPATPALVRRRVGPILYDYTIDEATPTVGVVAQDTPNALATVLSRLRGAPKARPGLAAVHK